MEVERSEDLCFYTLCVVRSPAAESTVNLRCPVAINDRTRRAVQVILEELGGGGNAAVAGAQIPDKSLEEVREALLVSIEKYYAEDGSK